MNCLCATFLAQMTSFFVRYDFIYHFSPISSQYLMMWGVDSPAVGQVRLKNYLPSQKIYSPHTNGVDFFQALRTMTVCRYLHVLNKIMMNTNLKQLHESVAKELLNKSYIVLTSSSPDQFSLVVSVFPSA